MRLRGVGAHSTVRMNGPQRSASAGGGFSGGGSAVTAPCDGQIDTPRDSAGGFPPTARPRAVWASFGQSECPVRTVLAGSRPRPAASCHRPRHEVQAFGRARHVTRLHSERQAQSSTTPFSRRLHPNFLPHAPPSSLPQTVPRRASRHPNGLAHHRRLRTGPVLWTPLVCIFLSPCGPVPDSAPPRPSTPSVEPFGSDLDSAAPARPGHRRELPSPSQPPDGRRISRGKEEGQEEEESTARPPVGRQLQSCKLLLLAALEELPSALVTATTRGSTKNRTRPRFAFELTSETSFLLLTSSTFYSQKTTSPSHGRCTVLSSTSSAKPSFSHALPPLSTQREKLWHFDATSTDQVLQRLSRTKGLSSAFSPTATRPSLTVTALTRVLAPSVNPLHELSAEEEE
ncbi:hypothetical protein CDD83_4474 [Cordyceps sp. RAO-2017]|nr:hypothetical protein CDD83_4474 [Cordyceps sp. RAO-2017]